MNQKWSGEILRDDSLRTFTYQTKSERGQTGLLYLGAHYERVINTFLDSVFGLKYH